MADNEEKLVKMLKYVSEHNDFYKNRIKEYGITNPLDITQWPILTRKELQENRYNMFSDGYKTKYFNQQLKRQSSSGSTGMPVNVYWDYKDWYASNMCLWRKRKEYYGITPIDKVVKFTLHVFNMNYKNENAFIKFESPHVLLVNKACLQEESIYIKLINQIELFSPKWLYIQPFVLNQLISQYKKLKVEPPKSLRYIESVGEILTCKVKQEAIDLFKVPVVNMYGSQEMNGIAYECPNKFMHILGENVYIERILKDASLSRNDRTIITNLNNRAMPLIRYDQGDVVQFNNKLFCECGNPNLQIQMVKGRTREYITRHGKSINSYLLLEIIDEVNNELKDIITTFSFIYKKSDDTMRCMLTLDDERDYWRNIVENLIQVAFAERGIINLNIKISYTKKICTSPKNIIFSVVD